MKVKEYLKFLEMVKSFQVDEKVSIFDKDPDYQIIDAKSKNSYIVTSWTHGKEPKNIYIVNKTGNKWSCNCPTRTLYCKHIDMVKEYLRKGKPNSFIDIELENDFIRSLNKKGYKV